MLGCVLPLLATNTLPAPEEFVRIVFVLDSTETGVVRSKQGPLPVWLVLITLGKSAVPLSVTIDPTTHLINVTSGIWAQLAHGVPDLVGLVDDSYASSDISGSHSSHR